MKRYLIALIVSLLTITAWAQNKNVKLTQSYNFCKARECMQMQDYEKGAYYLKKEIEEHEKNGYAYYELGCYYASTGNLSEALECANKAIKYLKNNIIDLSKAYVARGQFYRDLGKNTLAEADFSKGVELLGFDVRTYEERASFYAYIGSFDKAIKDFNTILEINPGNVIAFGGLADIAIKKEEFATALEYIEKGLKFKPNDDDLLWKKAVCLISLKSYGKAANLVFESLNAEMEDGRPINRDNWLSVFFQLTDSVPTLIDMHLRSRIKSQSDVSFWHAYAAIFYSKTRRYKEEIECFKKMLESGYFSDNQIYPSLARSYINTGDYRKALTAINNLLELDSLSEQGYTTRSLIYSNLGETGLALKDCDKLLEFTSAKNTAYALRYHIKRLNGVEDGAFEDIETAYSLNTENASYASSYARMLKKKGRKEEAESVCMQILAVPGSSRNYSATGAVYAHVVLGNREAAIAIMDSLLSADTYENLYNAACLYSLLGETDKSLDYLKTALEQGYNNFLHIDTDSDIENVRNLPRFEALVNEYRQKNIVRETDETDGSNDGTHYVSEIPFTRENGVYKVKCTINGLPLYFIFDTGASDVTMSSVEASFMCKNDYLSARDVRGRSNYQIADGSVAQGTVVNLESVKFGDLTLSNIKATIMNNQKAPLLLGQSVLQKLGKIEIDNNRKVIRITK